MEEFFRKEAEEAEDEIIENNDEEERARLLDERCDKIAAKKLATKQNRRLAASKRNNIDVKKNYQTSWFIIFQ